VTAGPRAQRSYSGRRYMRERTGGFGGAGKERAAHNAGGAQGQCLDDVARVLDAAVRYDGHTHLVRHPRHVVHGRRLAPSHRAHLHRRTPQLDTRDCQTKPCALSQHQYGNLAQTNMTTKWWTFATAENACAVFLCRSPPPQLEECLQDVRRRCRCSRPCPHEHLHRGCPTPEPYNTIIIALMRASFTEGVVHQHRSLAAQLCPTRGAKVTHPPPHAVKCVHCMQATIADPSFSIFSQAQSFQSLTHKNPPPPRVYSIVISLHDKHMSQAENKETGSVPPGGTD
jgi:hypothetical protein